MPDAAMRAAAAIRGHALRQAGRARNVYKGVVIRAKPLKIELFRSGEILDDDDFDLTQWMQLYDKQWGIDADDVVFLMREQGEYSVFDIESDKEIELA